MTHKVSVALLGFGTVGSSLVELLQERHEELKNVVGIDFSFAGIAVRDSTKSRSRLAADIPLTTDAASLVVDPSVDLVIELIGGIDPARELILAALRSGKPVITGNKELLANHGAELYQVADENSVDLLFEASTAGAIPILRPLRESLLGEDVTRVMGIVNGTTNYILTEMADKGSTFQDALADAQKLGYAESDPTADVEGHDAGAKASIMASLAFGKEVVADDVYCIGISGVTIFDITEARRLGYVVKTLALAEKYENGEISAHVYPALVPKKHPLAGVRGSYNAVFVEGSASSELMFYGKGAGGKPTASAVLGDLVDAAKNLKGKTPTHRAVPSGERATIRPIEDLESSFYVVIDAEDKAGVLSEIAGIFAAHGVSIQSMEQEAVRHRVEGAPDLEVARMVFLTQKSLERDFNKMVESLHSCAFVHKVKSVLRVLD